jgi:hypothetical protein
VRLAERGDPQQLAERVHAAKPFVPSPDRAANEVEAS